MSGLQSGWCWLSLGEAGEWCGGGTPSKQKLAYWRNGTVPWVSPKDMKSYEITETQDQITDEAVASSATRLIPPGAVLCVTRSGILARTFPVAVSRIPVSINQDLKALMPAAGIESSFVAWALRSAAQRILDECSKHGTTVHSVELPKLMRHHIPLAPREEQPRVVGAIESYFTRLDHASVSLERVQRNLTRYRASVLKAAVEGRLVPTEAEPARQEDRDYEPAEVLLQRILRERRHRWEEAELAKLRAKGNAPKNDTWKAKYKEPVAPDREGLPKLPEGWCWATTDQIAEVTVGYAFKSKEFVDEGMRLLRGDNIEPGHLRWKNTRFWPADRVDTFAHLIVEPGDVILAMDRPVISAGLKISMARATDTPCLLVQRVARLRSIVGENAWLYLAMSTQRFINHLQGSQTGTQLPHISATGISSYPVPLPPRFVQQAICKEVERLLSIVTDTSSLTDVNDVRARRLRQSILKWAFEGKLVDQDPTDEPASVLVERIQAERAASEAKKPKRRVRRKKKAPK